MRKVTKEEYSKEPERFEIRSGQSSDAPDCPYGNKYQWLGYDLEAKEYVRLPKKVFKELLKQSGQIDS